MWLSDGDGNCITIQNRINNSVRYLLDVVKCALNQNPERFGLGHSKISNHHLYLEGIG